jgi:hypothetical protein
MESGPVVEKPRSKSLAYLWLPLVGLALIGDYAAALIPAFAGKPINPQSTTGIWLVSLLFSCLLWKYLQRRVWVGAIIGLCVASVVLFAVGYITAMNRVH